MPVKEPKPVERFKPTKEQLEAARTKTVPDIIAPNLRVLFCGINPGLYTAAIGRHFGRPGNRFWPALYAGGFTPRLLSPWENMELLKWGYGITNLVSRATPSEVDLENWEYVEGGKILLKKVKKYKPTFLAVVGLGAYRKGFGKPKAQVGEQEDRIGDVRVWVLPNPSGLNAHYQPARLAEVFRELHDAAHQT